MLLAATFATLRGGYTLAWDNNETRGTLGWRAVPARHTNTAVDLLADLERFQQVRGARVGDLDNYVRTQGAAQFDVLASDEDPAASASIDADAFQRLHGTLSRFYRILVIDTGNNMRASNWEAAIAAADQLVIVSTIREDTAASAAWLVDGLRAQGPRRQGRARGHDPLGARLLERPGPVGAGCTTTSPSSPGPSSTSRTSQSLVAGGPIDFSALSKPSRDAWVLATAKVAEGPLTDPGSTTREPQAALARVRRVTVVCVPDPDAVQLLGDLPEGVEVVVWNGEPERPGRLGETDVLGAAGRGLHRPREQAGRHAGPRGHADAQRRASRTSSARSPTASSSATPAACTAGRSASWSLDDDPGRRSGRSRTSCGRRSAAPGTTRRART